jgi:predicted nuclease of restriction endonuclease-like (RecB) superfamily
MTSKTQNLVKQIDPSGKLLSDLRTLITDARQDVARFVNSALVMLYWKVGQRIQKDVLKEKRGGYGEEIVATVSRKLTLEFGNGFTDKNLRHMVRFAGVFPEEQIVYALSRQLSWTHFRLVIYLDDPLKRDFYAEMCRIEGWSTRTLENKIGGMLYERTALSKKPAELAKQELAALREEDKLTPDLVFRDPYFLDFLGLKDTYSEKDLETAILREMEAFILELGAGFTFVARQKRMTIGDDDFYLDLLFYHRKLQRLVAIELKLDNFKAEYKGQMELYLRWLEKYEQQPGEGSPIGLILCASKSEEQIELLQLGKSGIRVAAYMTELPPRDLLRKKLHEAIILARARLEEKKQLSLPGD